MKKYLTDSQSETIKLGGKFAKKLKAGDRVFMYGELGSGKTTFAKGIAIGLGIKSRIISPTFILHRRYDLDEKDLNFLNHIDLYRLESKKSINTLGLSEVFEDKTSITIVEWADRLKNLVPSKGHKIYFKHKGGFKREIKII